MQYFVRNFKNKVPRHVKSSVFGRSSGKSATLGWWGWVWAASRGQRTVANPLNCERKTAGGRGNYKAINRELCYVWELKYIFDCFGIDSVSSETLVKIRSVTGRQVCDSKFVASGFLNTLREREFVTSLWIKFSRFRFCFEGDLVLVTSWE